MLLTPSRVHMRLLAVLTAVFALTFTACNSTSSSSLGGSKTTRVDSMSYALGRDLGQSLQQQELDINPEALAAGLKAGMGEETQLTEEEMQALLLALQQEIRQKQMEEMMQKQAEQQNQNPAGGSAGSAVKIGEMAPEINLPTPDGGSMKLSDLRGKVVLIDFWASWCKPCRAENPNVVRMYNQYKDKGFEIFGVSLDRSKEAWVQAIQKDGLTWPHVSDLKFWNSEAAGAYGVSAIPYTVLVDREGKVIAERLRGPSLESKLAEVLN